MVIRITTWNVNGIRNPFGYQPWRDKRTFQAMFDILETDIIIMQETKIQRKDLTDDMVLVPGWDVYFSLPRHKKGYSGVAIYTRNETCAPIRAEEGITGILCPPKTTTSFRDLSIDQQIGGYPRPGQLSGNVDELMLDSEGRCVILEFPAFVLLGVYSPANRDESRAEFRMEFLEALDVRVRNLVALGKQVILTGDLNVIRSEVDSTNVAENVRKEGLSMDEWQNLPSRRLFNHLIFGGKVSGDRDEHREEPVLWDLCREYHPNRKGMNTCWDTKRNTRPANNGSRIDYILCSDGLRHWFTHADIQEGLMGSDHCPVFATMGDTVSDDSGQTLLLDVVNPPGMFKDGERLRSWSIRDVLPLSAKLIPEFDRRRSIRDMFTKKAGSDSPGQPSSEPSSPDPISDSGPVIDVGEFTNDPNDEPHDTDSSFAIVNSANSSTSSPNPQMRPEPPPPRKRPVGPSDLRDVSSKRGKLSSDVKTNGSSSGVGGGRTPVKAAAIAGKGQQTLQGFFKPVVAAPTQSVGGSRGNVASASPKPSNSAAASISSTSALSSSVKDATIVANPVPGSTGPLPSDSSPDPDKDHQTPVSETPTPMLDAFDEDRVFDPIEAKESWSKLLGRRVLPRCEHDEPCISLVTKKQGVNCGTSIYSVPFDIVQRLRCA